MGAFIDVRADVSTRRGESPSPSTSDDERDGANGDAVVVAAVDLLFDNECFVTSKHGGTFLCKTFFCACGVVEDNLEPTVDLLFDNYLKLQARASLQHVPCVGGRVVVRRRSRAGVVGGTRSEGEDNDD